MLVLVLFCFTFPLKGKDKDKIDAGKTPRSVCLCRVWLRAVLTIFGFSEMLFNDCRGVSFRGVWLRAVLVNFGFFFKYLNFFRKIHIWTPDSLYCRVKLETRKLFLLHTVLANFGFSKIKFPTPRSLSLHRVRLLAVLACTESHLLQISPRKRIFKKTHFKLLIRWVRFITKCQKISWHFFFKQKS